MNKRSRFKTLREYVHSQTRGKTQGDVARELGVSESSLSSYLSGARIPTREVALRIAKQCGVSLESLLDPEVAQRMSA